MTPFNNKRGCMGAAKPVHVTLLKKCLRGSETNCLLKDFYLGWAENRNARALKVSEWPVKSQGDMFDLALREKQSRGRKDEQRERQTIQRRCLQGQNTIFHVLWFNAIQFKKYELNEARWFATSNHSSASNTWRVKEETKWVNATHNMQKHGPAL